MTDPRPRRKKPPLAQTIGGVLFGFEQQVLRTMPPPEELVHQARPDDPVPAGDGTMLTITLPGDEAGTPPDPGSSPVTPASDPPTDVW
ncbi:MAG: hypothetical protein A2V85_04995 [Chloroflexi bacterium RBG_16_72_14]|nr:MAG: hypothetical protein A2V85_04995 [Chloroflexi bacterium RBG_16_72_14]